MFMNEHTHMHTRPSLCVCTYEIRRSEPRVQIAEDII